MPVLGIEGQSVIRKFLIGSSQTFTAPFTGKAIVTCIGGGGQGAAGSGAADLGLLLLLVEVLEDVLYL